MKPLYIRDRNTFLQDDKVVEVCKTVNAAKRRSRELQRSGVTVRRSN